MTRRHRQLLPMLSVEASAEACTHAIRRIVERSNGRGYRTPSPYPHGWGLRANPSDSGPSLTGGT